jgi:hypothetical protein
MRMILVEVAVQPKTSLGDFSEMGPDARPPRLIYCFERYLILLDGVFWLHPP